MADHQRGTDREGEWEEDQVEAAASEAGAIGGRAGDEDVDPAERPLQEAGQGEAEGFELAEQDLVESAESGTWTDPLRNPFPAESKKSVEQTYGEADHERSSERDEDDEE